MKQLSIYLQEGLFGGSNHKAPVGGGKNIKDLKLTDEFELYDLDAQRRIKKEICRRIKLGINPYDISWSQMYEGKRTRNSWFFGVKHLCRIGSVNDSTILCYDRDYHFFRCITTNEYLEKDLEQIDFTKSWLDVIEEFKQLAEKYNLPQTVC